MATWTASIPARKQCQGGLAFRVAEFRAYHLACGVDGPVFVEVIEDHLDGSLTPLGWVTLGHDLHPSQKGKRHQTRHGSISFPVSNYPEKWIYAHNVGYGVRVEPVTPGSGLRPPALEGRNDQIETFDLLVARSNASNTTAA